MRDWYRDWDCVECCQGDRCNYYATVSLISSSQLDEIKRLYFAKKKDVRFHGDNFTFSEFL